jgi:hypothetical protein
MNCGFDKEKLTGYYDGELESPEKSEVERHIGACSECLRDLGEIKSAALLVKDLPRHRAPASIAEGVSRETGARGRVLPFRRSRAALGWAASVAAALLVVANIVYFSGVRSAKEPAPMASAPPPAMPAVGLAQSAPEGPEASKLKDQVREERQNAPARKIVGGRASESKEEDPLTAREVAPRAPAKAEPAPTREPADDLAKRDVGRPAAAPAPAPPPPAAPPEPAPKQEKNLSDKAAAPTVYTIASADLAKSRSQVEAFFKSTLRADAREGDRQQRERAAAELAVELTDAQVAELRKELEKSGALVLEGYLDGRLANEELARLHRRAAMDAPKAAATGGAAHDAKGKEAASGAKPAPGGAGAAGKPAEASAATAKAPPSVLAPAAEQEKKSAEAPRRRIVLRFVSLPADKK